VAGADTDEVELALAPLLGEFGGRIDAWLLAEGVETWGEVEAFVRLCVPLAQGWLLGRPAPPWAAGCGRAFTAADEGGILAQVAAHAAADQGLTDVPPALVDQVRARITTVV
jgi:EAL domain-containing protein (putative c-di-GMP-specific phosphodiesterase class I)